MSSRYTAQRVLDARAGLPGATLMDLYALLAATAKSKRTRKNQTSAN